MQEFIYYNEDGLDFPLSDNILVTNKITDYKDSNFIVSNTNMVNTELVADEIDFYIKNSKDSIAAKIKNIKKLYEVNEIRFDLAQDMVFTEDVSNKVLLVCEKEWKNEILKSIVEDEFDLFHISEDIILDIDGHIGNLSVKVKDDNNEITLNVDQIIWFDEKELGMKQSGCFDPLKSTINDVLATIRKNISSFEYKKFTTYDKTICQYHERREEICGKCAEVCPTVAIVKNDEEKHPVFSNKFLFMVVCIKYICRKKRASISFF
jgi:ferredoxin